MMTNRKTERDVAEELQFHVDMLELKWRRADHDRHLGSPVTLRARIESFHFLS